MEIPGMRVFFLLTTTTLPILGSYQAFCGKSEAWGCSKPLQGLANHCLKRGLKEEMLVKCVENSIPEVLLRSCIPTTVGTAFSDCVVDMLARQLPGVVSECRADTKHSRKSGTLSQCVLARVKGTVYAQDVLAVCANPAILMAAYDDGCLGGGATQPLQEVSACSSCVCHTLQLEGLVSTCSVQAADDQYRTHEESSYLSQPSPSYHSSHNTGYRNSPPPSSYETPSTYIYMTTKSPSGYRNPSTPSNVYEMPTARPIYRAPMPSSPLYKTPPPPPPPTYPTTTKTTTASTTRPSYIAPMPSSPSYKTPPPPNAFYEMPTARPSYIAPVPSNQYRTPESSSYLSQPSPYHSSHNTGYRNSPPSSYQTPSPNMYEMPTTHPLYRAPMPSSPSYKTPPPPPPPTYPTTTKTTTASTTAATTAATTASTTASTTAAITAATTAATRIPNIF